MSVTFPGAQDSRVEYPPASSATVEPGPMWDGSLWVPRSADVDRRQDPEGLSVEGWQEVEPGVWEVTFDGTAEIAQYGVGITFVARDIFGQPAEWYARPYSRMRVITEPDPGSDVRVVAGVVQIHPFVAAGYGVSWVDPAGWCPYAVGAWNYENTASTVRTDTVVIVDGEFRHERVGTSYLGVDSVRCSPVVDSTTPAAEDHAHAPGFVTSFGAAIVGLTVFCPSGTPGPQTVRVRVGWEIIPDPPPGEEWVPDPSLLGMDGPLDEEE